MDDSVAANGFDEIERPKTEALVIEKWRERLQTSHDTEKIATDQNRPKRNRIPPADIIAAELAKEYKDKFIWNNQHKTWMIYEHERPGVWCAVDKRLMECQIQTLLFARGIVGYGSYSYITSICKFLSRTLVTFKWVERG
ncbi:MAG: hypothetical protein H0X31_00455 [Nostocaceae cyanobacterium]|nr:hypothetical protein [Nostocaceae cyanobacterium]